jgi:hypothetical protein
MLGQYLITEKYSHFSSQRVTKSRKRDQMNHHPDLHQMALIGLHVTHVTQYMYVLFNKVHIFIQKSQFTLARYGQECSISNKHLEKV